MRAKDRVYEYESENQSDVIEYDCNGDISSYSLWSEELNGYISVPVSLIARTYPASFEELQSKLASIVDGATKDEFDNYMWDQGRGDL